MHGLVESSYSYILSLCRCETPSVAVILETVDCCRPLKVQKKKTISDLFPPGVSVVLTMTGKEILHLQVMREGSCVGFIQLVVVEFRNHSVVRCTAPSEAVLGSGVQKITLHPHLFGQGSSKSTGGGPQSCPGRKTLHMTKGPTQVIRAYSTWIILKMDAFYLVMGAHIIALQMTL